SPGPRASRAARPSRSRVATAASRQRHLPPRHRRTAPGGGGAFRVFSSDLNPGATSVSRSSPEQKSRRDSSITAAALTAAASADCPGARASLRGLFLNTLGRHHLEADLVLDFLGDVRVLLQVHARIVLALTDALAVVAVPGAGLVDDALRGADLDDLALARDAGAIHDLELGFAKRR